MIRMMIFSPSKKLLHRYTPPTCTLELWSGNSPLPWRQRSAGTADWQFELRFDDPRVAEENQVAIRGALPQLDRLGEVVENYLQSWLKVSRPEIAASLARGGMMATLTGNRVSLADRETEPFLLAKGLIDHELHLGELSAQSSQSWINLTASQLFDLTVAIENYRRDIPQLSAPPTPKTESPPLRWTGGAILLLLLTGLGLWGSWQRAFSPTASLPNLEGDRDSALLVEPVPPVPLPPVPNRLFPNTPPALTARDPLPPASTLAAGKLPRTPEKPLQSPPPVVLPPPPIVPPAPNLPAGASSNAGRIDPLEIPASTASLPGNSPTSTLNPKTSPLKALPPPPALSPAPVPSEASSAMDSSNRQGRAIARREPPSPVPLLDVIPQVGEVRRYFQSRWQKPADLNRRLEYRLTLKSDGSLAEVLPLGKAAAIYQPQVGMPAIGQEFVSPLDQAVAQRIRLVLNPDGSVTSFLDE